MVTNPVSLVILGIMFLTAIVSNPKAMGAIKSIFAKKAA